MNLEVSKNFDFDKLIFDNLLRHSVSQCGTFELFSSSEKQFFSVKFILNYTLFSFYTIKLKFTVLKKRKVVFKKFPDFQATPVQPIGGRRDSRKNVRQTGNGVAAVKDKFVHIFLLVLFCIARVRI